MGTFDIERLYYNDGVNTIAVTDLMEDARNSKDWPKCSECGHAFDFEMHEPFAHCECGTTEWSGKRPIVVRLLDLLLIAWTGGKFL